MKSEEIWKTYPEFDFIQASTRGRIRTLDRVVPNGNHKCLIKGQILKQQHRKSGYMQVTFSVNGKTINRSVHRIVAMCFIENPGNLPQVNHRDCNPTNNRVDNLEWCDSSYNCQYREKYGTSMAEAQGHPLWAFDLKTGNKLRFRSQQESSQSLGVCRQGISAVIKGKRNQTGGYWFTNADSNAVENVRAKFGDEVATKVEVLMAQTATK